MSIGVTARALFLVVGATALGVAAFPAAASLQAQAPRSQWDGVYTTAQAERGAAVFTERCAMCHSVDAGAQRSEMSGMMPAPPLTGVRFTSRWNNQSLDVMVRLIQRTMPRDEPGTLSRQQAADIVAFVLRANDYPAGAAELPNDAEALKPLLFLADKPSLTTRPSQE